MNNELVPFSNDDYNIRALEIDGEPWFVAKDVTEALGTETRDLSKILDDDEVDTIHHADSLGRNQATVVISEAGLYSLILRSRKPEAKPFKRWVTHDVLPEIRKTGAFTPKLSNGDLARMILAEEAAKEQALAQLALASPKAAYYDAWFNTEGLIGKMDLARSLRGRFGGKVNDWAKRLSEGGEAPLWGKGSGARTGSIVLAHQVTMGRGHNKYVEDANGGDRLWLQGFATKTGVEWVLRSVERF